jgi:hypothetical protein
MGIFLEGVQVDTVSTTAGQVVTRTYQVKVRDGQLTLRLKDLGGKDPNVVIQGIQVEAVIAPPHREFDFGTASSPVTAGYTQATKNTFYSPTWGYGWQNGTVLDVDRQSGTALTRDSVYTTKGTFVVDVLNGTYDVSVNLGDTGNVAHDLMGVYFEGKKVDTVSTAAKQVVTRTYRVQVTDGQLTLFVQDLGGRDPNVVLEGLTLREVQPFVPPAPKKAEGSVEPGMSPYAAAMASAADLAGAHDRALAAEDLPSGGNHSTEAELILLRCIDDILRLANANRESHFSHAAARQSSLPDVHDLALLPAGNIL